MNSLKEKVREQTLQLIFICSDVIINNEHLDDHITKILADPIKQCEVVLLSNIIGSGLQLSRIRQVLKCIYSPS